MIAILSAICLGAWGLAPSLLPPPSPTPSVNAQEVQQLGQSEQGNGQAIQPNAKPSQIIDENASTKNQSSDHGKESSPDWITWFTGVIAAAAVLQFIVFIFQAFYMRRGLKLTKQAADAATESVQILNRARLVTESLMFYDVEDPAKATFRYVYVIANKGNTTAHVVETHDYVCIIEPPLPDTPPYQGQATVGHFSLGPTQIMTFTCTDLKKSEIDMAKIGHLHALGFIKYSDEFGRDWITRYARKYPGSPNIQAFVVNKPGYSDAS